MIKLVILSEGMKFGMPYRQLVLTPHGLPRMRNAGGDWLALAGDFIVRCVNNPHIAHQESAPHWPPMSLSEIVSANTASPTYANYDRILDTCKNVDVDLLNWLCFVEEETCEQD